jgi:hypothetical protein
MKDITRQIAATVATMLRFDKKIHTHFVAEHLWTILIEDAGIEDGGVLEMIKDGRGEEAVELVREKYLESVAKEINTFVDMLHDVKTEKQQDSE